jgi:superfamily I DNA/RNA helicase
MGAAPPGDDAVEALVGLIGRSWQIETTIGTELDEQQTAIRLLTEQQFAILDLLGSRRRALISGCAGSGKTMLAMEKARRLARSGYRVLLTCFNRNLGNWLAAQVTGDGVVAQRFLSLCAQYAQKAGVPLSKRPGESDDAFYDRLPDALCDALKVLPDRFDAIIVDEGQDFSEEWWAAMLSLLADPDDGVLYIFYDDNQRLYGGESTFPITDEPYHLSQNRRNTRNIHEAVMMFYQSSVVPECIGPEGRKPHSLQTGPGANEKREVERFIDNLVNDEKVNPGDIAVLTRRARGRSEWGNPVRHPSWSTTWDLAECADKVLVSTIHGFKGLERPVVIVCELQGVDVVTDVELLYVAFSRAREYLVVVGAGNLAGG